MYDSEKKKKTVLVRFQLPKYQKQKRDDLNEQSLLLGLQACDSFNTYTYIQQFKPLFQPPVIKPQDATIKASSP